MNNGDLYWRQMDILSPRDIEDVVITLIGCGGIGSPVGLMLAKMGFKAFSLYDPDTIELHNLPNQMFPHSITQGVGDVIEFESTIGMTKVDVLSATMRDFGGTHRVSIIPHVEPYEEQPLSGIVISGVDSMSARKTIWEGVETCWDNIPLYIDARMGAQVGAIYSIDPASNDDSSFFKSVALYDDAEAMEQVCTNRAILYNTFFIAALIGRQVRYHVKGLEVPREILFDLETLALVKEDAL